MPACTGSARATANYVALGQTYLMGNPQLESPPARRADFDQIFTTGKPVIFAFHGYPWLIHRLTYRRANHASIHVRGYKEEGSVTTPLDMAVANEMDRFHLVADVFDRVPSLAAGAAHTKQWVRDKLDEHHRYIAEHGEDLPRSGNGGGPRNAERRRAHPLETIPA